METGALLWIVTGLVTSVLAPGSILVARRWVPIDQLAPPAYLVAPVFVLLHAAITISLLQRLPIAVWAAIHVALLAGAVAYWLPVLGDRGRLDGIAKFIYLLLSAPALDFAGIAVLVAGSSLDGIVFLFAMLPVWIAALGLLWRAMLEDERQRRRALDDRPVG